MRLAKGISLFVIEFCFASVCLTLTLALTRYFASTAVLVCGLAVTLGSVIAIRLVATKWQIEDDAATWIASRSTRRLHPYRARYLRVIQQCFLWLPSACAMVFLFFYPFVSHILYAGRLKPCRVPIPWTWVVLQHFTIYDGASSGIYSVFDSQGLGRFGVTPFWQKELSLSFVEFRSDPGSIAFDDESFADERRWAHATQVSTSELAVGDMKFECWQYFATRGGLPPLSGNWAVQCASPESGHLHDFTASFLGRKEDIPAFYSVLREVRRSN